MAKKGKDDTPTANSVPNRDIIQRLNFLYQASVYLNTLPSSQQSATSSSTVNTNIKPSTTDVKTTKKRRNKPLRHVTTASELSRSYIATMKSVGQKTTVKIDPGVKRTLCKGCDLTLIPGATATVRVKKSPSDGCTMIYTCTECKVSRRIPAPPTVREDVIAANDVIKTNPLLVDSGTSGTEATSIPINGDRMDIDLPKDDTDTRLTKRKKQKKNKVQPRIPPLFARDVGHIVFCGNEKLLDNGLGDGVYIT